MRQVLLVLCMTLFPSPVWADCVGTVEDYGVNPNGFIQVRTVYSVNGVVEETGKPGNFDVHLYTPAEWNGKTEGEITTLVQTDLLAQCARVIKSKYQTIAGEPLIEARTTEAQKTIDAVETLDLQGVTNTLGVVDVPIDADGDGIAEQTWTLSADGTKTIK